MSFCRYPCFYYSCLHCITNKKEMLFYLVAFYYFYICEPLRFHRVNWRSHRSDRFVPAYLFCISFMISFRKHYCSLPTAFFLSSVCQSTDVETIRCFLNACIICFASGDIQAPAMEERYRVSPSLNTLLQFLVNVYSLPPSRVII